MAAGRQVLLPAAWRTALSISAGGESLRDDAAGELRQFRGGPWMVALVRDRDYALAEAQAKQSSVAEGTRLAIRTRGTLPLLSEAEVEERLGEIPDWERRGDAIEQIVNERSSS